MKKITVNNLKVDEQLYKFINEEVIPGTNINPNNFWLEKKSNKLMENHNFLWLNLINRKTDGKNIQKIIYLWMLKYFKFKRKIWDNSLISTRIISWILNSDIIIILIIK